MEIKHTKSQVHCYTLIRLFSLFLVYLLLSCSNGIAQGAGSPDKKTLKLFEEAKIAYNQRKYKEAENLFKQCLKRDNSFIEAHTILAYLYLDIADYEKAKESFIKAVELNELKIPNNLYFLGELELQTGQYLEAEKWYNRYLSIEKNDQNLINRSKDALASVEFAKKQLENPVPFHPKNLGASINSEFPEYFPCLTVDQKTILYTRRLPFPESPVGYNEDFFIAIKKDGDSLWQTSSNLSKPINTENNEGAPSLSPDGQILFFTACEFLGDYGPQREGLGSCDLFYTLKSGNTWERPNNLGTKINSIHWETQPSFSSDGKTLYFIRGKKSRSGSRTGDIYTSTLGPNGWTEPQMLPANINTKMNEESVFIHPDGKTLYFSSDGHPGMGNLDIFISRKDEQGNWSDPINLGYPINTHKNENSLLVSADGKEAYFASDREEGYGGLDLYSFELPEQFKPQAVSYFAGVISDKESKQPLGARFELIDLSTGELIVESYSNPGNGEFLVSLPVGKDYALNASKPGYLFYSENFSLSDASNVIPEKKNVPLQAIKVGESIVLKNIFFETAKYNLVSKSKIELDKLVTFLQKNGKVSIEISGHTDSVGNEQANKVLSENRAKAVLDYLIEKGISPERLSAKGYGAENPIASNETEKGRALNRRTEFKILSIN